jgi:hypothetical protein
LDVADPEYSAVVVPEAGVAANVYTPDANFSVTGSTVGMVSLLIGAIQTFEDMQIVPGDFFEDSSGNEHLIVAVSGSTLTLAEDTGVTAPMSGRIFRRETP